MATDIFKALPLSTFSSASLTTSFQKLNSTPFGYPVDLLYMINDSSTAVTYSFDGVTSQGYIRAGSDKLIPAQQNRSPKSEKSAFPAQTTVWVKGTAGTGTIALEAYYNQP